MMMCPSAPCRNWSIWSWRQRTASCLWSLQRRAGWSTCRTLWHRCWTIPSLSGLAALCMSRSTLMMWTSWGNSSVLQKTPWQVQNVLPLTTLCQLYVVLLLCVLMVMGSKPPVSHTGPTIQTASFANTLTLIMSVIIRVILWITIVLDGIIIMEQ